MTRTIGRVRGRIFFGRTCWAPKQAGEWRPQTRVDIDRIARFSHRILLKSVTGLWMLQACRNCWTDRGQTGSYAELVELADREPAFVHVIDPDHELFLHPADMCAAIDRFCSKIQQPTPSNPGAYVRCILESLA